MWDASLSSKELSLTIEITLSLLQLKGLGFVHKMFFKEQRT